MGVRNRVSVAHFVLGYRSNHGSHHQSYKNLTTRGAPHYPMLGVKRENVMKSKLFSGLTAGFLLAPAAVFAQAAPNPYTAVQTAVEGDATKGMVVVVGIVVAMIVFTIFGVIMNKARGAIK
jgi:hypothetical protein